MSIARPSQCLFCTFTRSCRPPSVARRKFHSSPTHEKRKPKHESIKAEELPGAIDIRSAEQKFSKFSKKELKEHYSPEQLEAIEAAQKVSNSALARRTGTRTDPWSIDYFDDLTEIDPVVDQPVRAPWKHTDKTPRLKTEDELTSEMIHLMKTMPKDEDAAVEAWDNFDKNLRLTVGPEKAERNARSALAPELPKMGDPAKKKKSGETERQILGEEGSSPALLRLMQMTGYKSADIVKLRVKTIISHRVVNQTRLGKISKMYMLTVAGNGNGLIGIGEGKAEEPPEARLQSQVRAIRNMQPIMRYEGRTIFGDVKGKVSATELELFARPPGFGLRCQQYIWEICRCAGISDLAARVTRARNPMNTVKATVQALVSQKDPEEIARGRGKKLVDVRKVYYAGQV